MTNVDAMRKLIYALFISGFSVITACQDSDATEESEFTGNEALYALEAGSTYPISGTATFKEKKDGSTVVSISISGTEGDLQHPVHLHLGNISTPSADVSALLNPVVGKTGVSETTLTMLADESTISYKQLIELNACIKIHLSSSGPDKDVVLAAGNIGEAAGDVSGGRLGVSVCKSE
jgi:hypothetical protein